MKPLDEFRQAVLRWNRSFSLVSRQDPEGQTDRLLRECLLAADLIRPVLAELPGISSYLYADLGTGGGFPGLLWAHALGDDSGPGPRLLEAHLVEPRDKRAWFLGQTAQAMGLAEVSVHQKRWGQGGALSETDAELLILSMKALHLPDPDLLEAVRRVFPGLHGPFWVVRFVTAEDARQGTFDPGLGVPASSETDLLRPHHRFLPLPDPSLHSSLLLSCYPADAF